MKKELYLYSPFYDFIAEELISQIEENMDNDITLRENTPGGSVYAAYGVYTKIKEHGNVHLKVDGSAMSAGAFLPLYCKSSECLDVSRFVFHRADMFVENAQDQKFLDDINKDLKAKMKMKIDGKLFKEITGLTIDDLFNPESRIDITLTGTQAKKLGLVDKVNKLTPAMQSEISAFNHKFYNVAATSNPTTTVIKKEKISKPTPMTKMNLEQFKAKYPKTYAKAFAAGVAAEKERVETILAFIDIDPKSVKETIESGKPLSGKQMAEMSIKQNSPEVLKRLAENSPEKIVTGQADEKAKTAKEAELEKFEKEVRAAAGLDKKAVK